MLSHQQWSPSVVHILVFHFLRTTIQLYIFWILKLFLIKTESACLLVEVSYPNKSIIYWDRLVYPSFPLWPAHPPHCFLWRSSVFHIMFSWTYFVLKLFFVICNVMHYFSVYIMLQRKPGIPLLWFAFLKIDMALSCLYYGGSEKVWMEESLLNTYFMLLGVVMQWINRLEARTYK